MKTLKLFWKTWKAFGHKVGTVQSYILYSLFYLLLLSVVSIVTRLFFDPLRIKSNAEQKSNFQPWLGKKETVDDARMQF